MSDINTTGAPARPTFLTVLCILSFIGCGMGIFTGVTGYFTNTALISTGSTVHDELTSAMDEAMDDAEMTEAGRELASTLGEAMGGITDFAAMAKNSIASAVLCIVILIGVLMMWKLKKVGFYIYTVGQIALVAAPFVLVGGLAGGLMATLGAIFPILFIILYALNLKHMS